MTKVLHRCFGLAILAALTLTGCQLYFGNGDDTSGDCPPGGNRPPGTMCDSSSQCAAGCFCQEGKCEEGGFCGKDTDCPAGYSCDERSSCVPDGKPVCTVDGDCLAGSECVNGGCTTTCVCETDADAKNQGYDFCDEIRSTCKHAGASSCGGAVTCTNPKPVCPAGTVPMVTNGCWADTDLNGQLDCGAIASCDVTPVCAAYQHEADCDAGTGCTIVKKGINCTVPGGGTCQDGQPGCVCAMYVFDSCR